MKTMHRILLTAALLAASVPLATFSASAFVLCASAEPVQANDSRSGVVAPGTSHWYVHQTVGPATTRLDSGPATDADLYVWDNTCQNLLCASTYGTGAVDTCTVNGGFDYHVEVRHYSGVGDYVIDFSAVSAPVPDVDQDAVPDDVERSVCGRQAVHDTINGAYPYLGRCASMTDYQGNPILDRDVDVPTNVRPGPDADRDGVPAYVTVERTRVSFRTWSQSHVQTSPASSILVPVDTRDNDASWPAQSVFTVGPVPTGGWVGADQDGDRLPGFVYVTSTTYTVDRRDGSSSSASTTNGVVVDRNDQNANDPLPVQDTVDRVMAIVNAVRDIVDKDRDLVPDASEPALCSVEDRNTDLDGHCTVGANGTPDYHPPWRKLETDGGIWI